KMIFRFFFFFFFSSRRRHTRSDRDWSSDVCSSDLAFQRLQPVDVVLARLVLEDERRVAGRRKAAFGLLRLGAGRAELRLVGVPEIGRASCREKWRARWAPDGLKRKENDIRGGHGSM